ncbi:hypothetical protein X777_10551 [Ooceraea biroi]|uniref:Uncharacterized protein n=1 Tax=Ooceraea biroi TaxID=2015173 RepID=A0A026W4H4_OOCBI|nr:hypothetical protein X777_10551 [Ooceraea biroi]
MRMSESSTCTRMTHYHRHFTRRCSKRRVPPHYIVLENVTVVVWGARPPLDRTWGSQVTPGP